MSQYSKNRKGTEMGSKSVFCTACHWSGKRGKSKARGSFGIELVIWIIFFVAAYSFGWILIIPALVYSFWRLSSRGTVCPNCGHKALIPAGSPRARSIMNNDHQGWDPDQSDDYSYDDHDGMDYSGDSSFDCDSGD